MKNIFEFAEKVNITEIGIIKAEYFDSLKELLKTDTPFVDKDIEERVNPFLILDNAKSIIVCLFPYYTKECESNLSKFARCIDYHKVGKEKLEVIAKNCLKGEYRCFVDTGPLVERFLAHRAGLGFIGKNRQLTNKRYGSYVCIGYIVAEDMLEVALGSCDVSCLECGECLRNCPTNALETGFFNCISYLTQSKNLTKEQRGLLKNHKYIFGCDFCIDCCPYNLSPEITPLKEFFPIISNLNIEEIKSMSNKQFKEKFKDYTFSFRGKRIYFKKDSS